MSRDAPRIFVGAIFNVQIRELFLSSRRKKKKKSKDREDDTLEMNFLFIGSSRRRRCERSEVKCTILSPTERRTPRRAMSQTRGYNLARPRHGRPITANSLRTRCHVSNECMPAPAASSAILAVSAKAGTKRRKRSRRTPRCTGDTREPRRETAYLPQRNYSPASILR